MAKREIHNLIPLMALLSLLDKYIILVIAVFYFATIIHSVATHLNLPLFTIVRNVYIDGVFDLCHVGHKLHIQRAQEYGNRVIVGVMSDDDVKKYKREPVMSLEERVREISALRCVYQVIPGAPCFGMDKAFIKKYNLHVVLCSPEYDKPDDKYYKLPRELGILKVLPRTEGISTSDIIRRITERGEDASVNKQAESQS